MSFRVLAVLVLSSIAVAQNAGSACDARAWADRDHFREANAKLMEQKPDRRVVVLGGSMLASWDLSKSFPDKDYVNRSIAGQESAQLLMRFTQDAAQLRPRVLVIAPGLDDISAGLPVSDIQENIVLIAQLAKAHGMRVAYSSLPAINSKTSAVAASVTQEKVRELNRWMFLYAKDHGDTYVDFWSPLGDSEAMLKPEFAADGMTLNEAAFRTLAPVLEKRLAEAIVAPSGKLK